MLLLLVLVMLTCHHGRFGHVKCLVRDLLVSTLPFCHVHESGCHDHCWSHCCKYRGLWVLRSMTKLSMYFSWPYSVYADLSIPGMVISRFRHYPHHYHHPKSNSSCWRTCIAHLCHLHDIDQVLVALGARLLRIERSVEEELISRMSGLGGRRPVAGGAWGIWDRNPRRK